MIASLSIILATILAKIALDRYRRKHKFIAESTSAWLAMAAGCGYIMLLALFNFELLFPSGRTAKPEVVLQKAPFGIAVLLTVAAIQQLIAMYRRRRKRIQTQKMDTNIKPQSPPSP